MRPILMASGVVSPPAALFDPVPGTYTKAHKGSVSFTITSSSPVVWNWSSDGGLATSNVLNGGTAMSITFSLSTAGADAKSSTVLVSAAGNSWEVDLTAIGTGETP